MSISVKLCSPNNQWKTVSNTQMCHINTQLTMYYGAKAFVTTLSGKYLNKHTMHHIHYHIQH